MSPNVAQSWSTLTVSNYNITNITRINFLQFYIENLVVPIVSGTPLSSLGGVITTVDDQTKTRLVAIDSAAESTILD